MAAFVKVIFDCSLPGVTFNLDTPAAADSAAILSRILPPTRVSGSGSVKDDFDVIFLSSSDVSLEDTNSLSTQGLLLATFINDAEPLCPLVCDGGHTCVTAGSPKPSGTFAPFSEPFQGASSPRRTFWGRKTAVAMKRGLSLGNFSVKGSVFASSCMQPRNTDSIRTNYLTATKSSFSKQNKLISVEKELRQQSASQNSQS